VDRNHYPETLAACYLVNPPGAMAAVLRLVSPLVPPATRRKARGTLLLLLLLLLLRRLLLLLRVRACTRVTRAAAQIVVLGSGAAVAAALQEALGPDVRLPDSVLNPKARARSRAPTHGAAALTRVHCWCVLALSQQGVPCKPHEKLPAEGAGIVDAGACCFEFIADVQRSLAAGPVGGGAAVHGHAVLTSLLGQLEGAAAAEGGATGSKPRALPRRATFTLALAEPSEPHPPHAPRAPPVLDRKQSGATVYHDADEGSDEDFASAAAAAAALEREHFYTVRMMRWATDAALAESEDLSEEAPAEEAAQHASAEQQPSCWARCGCFAAAN
jgi:hypothetical protein